MKKLIASIALVTSVAVGAASVPACTAAQAQQLIAPAEQLGICILQAAVSDLVVAISDPLSLVGAIISSCATYGAATAAQVLQVIEEALASTPAVDAAVQSVAMSRLHKAHMAARKVVAMQADAGASGQ